MCKRKLENIKLFRLESPEITHVVEREASGQLVESQSSTGGRKA